MSNKFEYNSYGISTDGSTYCSGLETIADNLIEDNDNDAAIVFPHTQGWINARSTDYIVNTDNARIILPSDIYKITSFKLLLQYGDQALFSMVVGGMDIPIYLFFDDNDQKLTEMDLTDYVVEDAIYSSLKSHGKVDTALTENANKNNVFVYSGNEIDISNLKNNKILPDVINWQMAIRCALKFKIGEKYKCNYKNSVTGEIETYSILDILKWGSETIHFHDFNIKNLCFRIEYIPISTKTKIKARKAAKTTEEYLQPFNQRAEINDATALGKSMYLEAQKTGTEELTLVRWHKNLSEIPPLGARVKHNNEYYICTGERFDITNTVNMKVTYTLSKNWSNKSKHLSVDQKYRNYKIPADILWRNLYYEDYVVISTAEYTVGTGNSGGIKHSSDLSSVFKNDTSEPALNFFLYKEKAPSADRYYEEGVTVPCSTVGLANSLLFVAQMKDNLSAGLRLDSENRNYCEDVFYCYQDGTLDSGNFVIAKKMSNANNDIDTYPYSNSKTNNNTYVWDTIIFNQTFSIDKDPGEALKFTYQIHFVEEDPNIVIGEYLTKKHPLITSQSNVNFQVRCLSRKIRQGEEKILDAVVRYDNGFDVKDESSESFSVTLKDVDFSDAVAWAITDENGNLYVGCNDVTKTKLYFSHIHKRK